MKQHFKQLSKKTFIGIVLMSTLMFFTGCNSSDSTPCPDCMPPEPFRFSIIDKEDSIDLIFNERYKSDSINIYFSEENTRHYINFEISTDSSHEQSVIESLDMLDQSSLGNKDFYLYLDQSDTDTLYLDAEDTVRHCCVFYSVNFFLVNGIEIHIDTTDNVFKLTR